MYLNDAVLLIATIEKKSGYNVLRSNQSCQTENMNFKSLDFNQDEIFVIKTTKLY